jgi:predicted N-formylglutamate amidohydrolase
MISLFLSCEHGGNHVPAEFESLFNSAPEILETHRAIDFGTLDLFKKIKKQFDFAKSNELCRLIIECNRSINHPKLFSEFSATLDQPTKNQILKQFYLPYRNAFENEMRKRINGGGKVLHISLHSFTPNFKGEERTCDIGLLYDPSIIDEKRFSENLKVNFQHYDYKVRMNYPYKGTADGFTTYLRKRFPVNYIGIEIEINQVLSSQNVFNPKLKTDFKTILNRDNLLRILQD